MNIFYFIGGGILFVMLFYFLRKNNNSNQKVKRPEMSIKNKWLYPTDNFGEMKKGVVHDSVADKIKPSTLSNND